MLFKLVGAAFIALAILDVLLYFFANIDVTGVSWSPYALGIVGSIAWTAGDR